MKSKLFLPAFFLPLATGPAFALYCGTNLVVEGQSKFDVLQRCGDPAYADSRVEYRWGPPAAPMAPRPLDSPEPYSSGPVMRQVVIDEWVYNFGSTQLMPQLLFENGRLISIRSLGYGR